MLKIISIAGVLLFFKAQICAQNTYHPKLIDPLTEQWRWNSFPEIEGAGVRCMTQTKSGKLLFGSNHGVLIYDGFNWNSLAKDSLLDKQIVTNLFSTSNDIIYAATDSGLFRLASQKWEKLFPLKYNPQIAKLYKVGKIKQLNDGSLLISTGQTFYSGLLHLKNDCFTFFSTESTIKSLKKNGVDWNFKTVPTELTNDKGFYIEDFFIDHDQTIWGVAAPEKEHIKIFHLELNTESEELNSIAIYSNDDAIHDAYRNLIFRNDNEIWVTNGVHNVGINIFNGKKWRYEEPDKRVCDNFLHASVIKSTNGTIWFGGLGVIYAYKNKKWLSYRNIELSIPSARIDLFEDHQGFLWVLGKQKELARIDYSSKIWMTYKDLNYQCESADGKKYFLSIEGSIVVQNKNSWYTISDEENFPSHPVKILMTKDGDLWVAGSHHHTAAISHFDGDHWKMDLFPEVSWGIDYRAVFHDISGDLWFGAAVDIDLDKGQKAGVIRYHPDENGKYKAIHYPGRQSTFMYNAYGIGQSRDGRIWVGGSHLASFDGVEWKPYYQPVEQYQNQECIRNLPDGKMWIGSRFYGVYCFDGETWLNYDLDAGLLSNTVISILPLSDQNVWVATDKDFCRFDGKNWATKIFDKQMTLSREGGELLLGLDSSLWINKSLREWKRRVLINRNMDNEVLQNFFCYNYKPDNQLPETTILTAPGTSSFRSSIVIEWTGKDYFNITSTERMAYSYRLNDRDWSPFLEKNYLTYYGLPDGTYTFEVRSRDQDFNIDESPTKIEFVVSPPIWKQSWFILLIITFIIVIIIYQWSIYNRNHKLTDLNKVLKVANDKLKEQKEFIVDQNKRELESMNAKMRFFTNISHEFRTPLTLIAGTVHRIIHGKNENLPLQTHEDFDTIERNTNRLLKLINQLMDFRKLETGQLPLELSQVDIVVFLEEIYSSFKRFAEKNGIDLLFEKQQVSLMVWIDEDKIEKVLINLISNAIKFTPESGKIKIILEQNEQNFILKVCDTGIGIDPSDAEKIFQPFYQTNSGIAFSNQGTGIGLSFVKNLVELHKGTIQLASVLINENEYKTCFEVILPISPEEQQIHENNKQQSNYTHQPSLQSRGNRIDNRPPDNENKLGTSKKYLVLFVDDNEELRRFVQQSLEENFNVSLAENGEDGLKRVIDLLPDIIISDVMMPKMNGIDMCKAIKNDIQISHIPVILLTSRSTEEQYLDGYASRADDYLTKPFSVTLLIARIRNLIEIRKSLKEQFSKSIIQLPYTEIENENEVESEFMKKVISIIETNMMETDFNVEALGEKVGISSRHLLNKIQSLTGQSPVELIRTLRLKRAARLLTEKKLNISETAYEVGFSSPGYFTKCFQKQYNISPSEFLNKNAHS